MRGGKRAATEKNGKKKLDGKTLTVWNAREKRRRRERQREAERGRERQRHGAKVGRGDRKTPYTKGKEETRQRTLRRDPTERTTNDERTTSRRARPRKRGRTATRKPIQQKRARVKHAQQHRDHGSRTRRHAREARGGRREVGLKVVLVQGRRVVARLRIATMSSTMRLAVVCASNQNRSMEAHQVLRCGLPSCPPGHGRARATRLNQR